MRKWLTRSVLGSLVLGAVVLIVYAYWPKPILVELATVSQGPFEVTLEQEGKTRVRERYVVDAPIAGVASRIELLPGTPVKEGQELLTLRPLRSALLDPQARAAATARLDAAQDTRRLARANAERVAAGLAASQRDVARLRGLFPTGAVAKQQVENAETLAATQTAELNAARASERVAEHDIEAAKAALGAIAQTAGAGLSLTSPVSGVVLRLPHEHERVVSPGTPLIEVGDVTHLEVIVDVLSRDAVSLAPGMVAWIDAPGLGKPLAGRVRTVEPAAFTRVSALGVEEQRVNVLVDFAAGSPAAPLGDGYVADVRFVLWRADTVLQAPASAAFRQGSGWAAFVVEDGRVKLRSVELGRRSRLGVEVKKGLIEGERVIVYPGALVADGVSVKER